MEVRRCLVLKNTKNDFEFTLTIPEGPTWGVAIDACMELLQQVHFLAAESQKQMAVSADKSDKSDIEALQ